MKYLRLYKFDSKTDKISNEKIILRISGCQYCPLMRYEKDNKCVCRYFKYFHNNILQTDIRTIGIRYNIFIPSWCELPESINELWKSDQIFEINTIGIRVHYRNDIKNNYSTQIISAEYYNENHNKGLLNYLPALITQSVFNNLEEDNDEEIKKEIINTSYEICSICGEEDETVIRNEHNGMCDDCWELAQNDETILKQAFINNFRLKRKVNIKTDDFKFID